jgi:DNA polymerase III sliding clamp (beta) subunit (PCNA family)
MSTIVKSSVSSAGVGIDCTVDRERLLSALTMAEAAIDAKPIKDAQRFARLVTTPERRELQVFGTDASVTIDVGEAIPVSGMNREGATLLPVGKLRALLSDVTSPKVWIYSHGKFSAEKGGEMRFKWEGGVCSLPVPGSNDLPVPDSFDDQWDFYAIDPHELGFGLASALPVAEGNHHIAALAGVYVAYDAATSSMDFCGSDGRQMAVYTAGNVEITNRPAAAGSLHRRGADLLSRLIKWAYPDTGIVSEPVLMALSNSSVLFELRTQVGRCTLKTRLNEGRFPKYKQVLAMVDDSYQHAEIRIADLVTAFRQAAVCLDGESVGVTLRMKPGSSTLLASTPEVGTATVQVQFVREVTTPISVTVDLRLFLRSLQAMTKGLACELSIRDGESMLRLKNGDYVYTIMPLVTPWEA